MKNIPPENFLLEGNSFSKLFFRFLSFFFLSIIFSSCSSKIYFTKETREFAEKNNISLTKLQFYVDRKVELRRELSSNEVNATGGKIVLEDGKQIYIITLSNRTGGQCIKVKDNRTVEITFEGGDTKTLTFHIPLDGYFGDYASDYELVFPNKDKNEIKYDGQTYLVSVQPKLKVKKKQFKKLKIKKRRMKGVKVK